MSSNPSCKEVRDLAPELALNIASGEDRARALDHIATCPECRRFVDELATAADEVLILAPEREPTVGFEKRVLSAIDERKPVRRRWAFAAAATLVAAALGAGAVFWSTADERELAGSVRSALAEADGKYFSVLPMHDSSGAKVANVFAYEGHPSWVFVVWEEPLDRDTMTIQAHLVDGDKLALGTFDSDGTKRTWGSPLPGSLHDLSAISVLASHGVDSTASFHRGD
ncbi:MAG TPA: zf-HC2 domain-containing protein [Actinomycetota bacterium]|nr:zf-HC2 domain-containing protein [Actinomycetota bacterium]